MPRSLVQWLDRFPPCLCRFVARKNHGRRRMTSRDLAIASGLAESTLLVLSRKISWKGVRPETIDAYTKACGVNIFSLKKHRDYLTKDSIKMSYIRRSNRQGQRIYSRIQKLLIKKKADESGSPGGKVL